MSFASFEFLAFLPVVVAGYWALTRVAPRVANAWLVAASLAFYARGGWHGLPYLLAAAGFNCWLGQRIAAAQTAPKKRLLQLGLVANIGQLLVVKYSGFFLGSFGLGGHALHGALPIGISFYTLFQLAYLLDCYEGLATPNSGLHHLLFSSFFPYVTMGPIVRTRDMKPLLVDAPGAGMNADRMARGFELFVLGLFKKAVIAQSCAHLADPGWALLQPSMLEAWLTTIAFTFELYFDFSGYSDMALGMALLFGVELPRNFDSPYRSTSIIMFWRRWHISLSAFITTYIYTPLLRLRRRPSFAWAMSMTIVAMTIAGLWHGAAWTFVAFGLLHGIALVVNNAWRKTKRRFPAPLGGVLTFSFLLLTLVLFRASNMTAAGHMFGAMLGSHGLIRFDFDTFLGGGPGTLRTAIAVVAGISCFVVPNSNAISNGFRPSTKRAVLVGLIALVATVFMNSLAAKEFIYRDF
jgi:D-alanyl-lipoteichoic acid acyltransferase DltB (MBOAT superfamily)